MGKKLAIKGHPTRGKEVIELLEMLGGDNRWKASGNIEKVYYSISNGSIIYSPQLEKGTVVFTLDEFYKKYQFKVGDKVVYTKFGGNCDDYAVTIESMKWTGTTIEYTFNDYVTCLAKDLKMWNGEPEAVISGIYLNDYDYADEVELNLGDYEIKVRGGRTYAVKKKHVYPTTYKECCKNVFGLAHGEMTVDVPMHYSPLIIDFAKLLICRDAYWKIASDEMELDKSWEPDWSIESEIKYVIEVYRNNVRKNSQGYSNTLLAFPTIEMRDTFYENFKDLIEACKKLL